MFTHYAFYVCIFSHYIMHVITISISLVTSWSALLVTFQSLNVEMLQTKFLDLFSITTLQIISSRPGFKNHLLMAHTLVSPTWSSVLFSTLLYPPYYSTFPLIFNTLLKLDISKAGVAIVMIHFKYQCGWAMLPRYMIKFKYYSGCFWESVFRWDSYLNQ